MSLSGWWLEEDPSRACACSFAVVRAFARYGEVYFDNCVGGTLQQELVPGENGFLITLTDANGNALSTAQIVNDTLVKVVYTGP